MGLFDKLEEIRNRSEAAKKKLLFIWLTISMTIVIIIWIGILRLEKDDAKEEDNKAPNPFEILKKSIQ